MFVGHSHTPLGSQGDNARDRRPQGKTLVGRLIRLALLPTLLVVSGCVPETRVPVFPVSGKVTFKGQPAKGAQVVLSATRPNEFDDVAPIGVVGDDGSFSVGVYEPGDGAPEGDYVVTVLWFKQVGEAAGPNVRPKEYASPRTPPIKVSVKGGPTQIPPIAIK